MRNDKLSVETHLIAAASLAVFLIIIFLLSGCRSESKVTFGGEAKVRAVLDVNFQVCDSLPDLDKIECVKTLLEVLKTATDKSGDLSTSGEGK